jgi:hypothetical protein
MAAEDGPVVGSLPGERRGVLGHRSMLDYCSPAEREAMHREAGRQAA